jgi:hypothetical protein
VANFSTLTTSALDLFLTGKTRKKDEKKEKERKPKKDQ